MTERQCSAGGMTHPPLDTQAGHSRPAPGAGEERLCVPLCVVARSSLLHLPVHFNKHVDTQMQSLLETSGSRVSLETAHRETVV